ELTEREQQEQLHTKGTAMSFGFRKKLNGTPKKFKKLLEGGKTQTDTKDDNGNAAPPIHFEKVGVAATKTTTTTTTNTSNNRTGAAGKRFGYRGALVPRPASTSLTTTTTTSGSEDSEESAANAQNNNPNNNNNNGNNGTTTTGQGLVSNCK
ncbi:GH22563, partial [Drosophila grimshawi]